MKIRTRKTGAGEADAYHSKRSKGAIVLSPIKTKPKERNSYIFRVFRVF